MGYRLSLTPLLRIVQVWDLRSMAVSGTAEAAHAAPVRDVDLSPQHQHLAVTGGDDGRVRMWDLRWGQHTHSVEGTLLFWHLVHLTLCHPPLPACD